MTKNTTKGKNWVKFLRLIIYLISIPGVTIGASLIKTSNLSSSYADGTYIAQARNGKILFIIFLIVLSGNILWGILRWFLRGYREHWRTGQIIGKLIGGGLWRTLAVALLLLASLLLLTPAINNLIKSNVVSEQTSLPPFDPDYAEHRLEFIAENFENLDLSEVITELEELTLSNIRFDSDASSNKTTSSNNFLAVPSAYAKTTSTTTLNKAVLSSGGKFVVFYTDTGDDAISDADAKRIGELSEKIIAQYKNNLNFDYSYKQYLKIANNYLGADVSKQAGLDKVLTLNNLDPNILSNAMPIYVANPYTGDSKTLATYAGRHFLDFWESIIINLGAIFDVENSAFYSSAISFPFINVLPKNINSISLPQVLAHELGHHYADLYADAHNFRNSYNNFIDETAPNWMAINVLPNEPADSLINKSHYNKIYLGNGTSTPINQRMPGCAGDTAACEGYPAVAFLQNYYNLVNDSKTKIMNALASNDALTYLYNEAGANDFAKVMVSLAEKNLTGDYGGKLTNMVTPKGEALNCAEFCTKKYSVAPAAINYLYFATTEYKDTKIKFVGSDNTRVSILGLTESGKFEILSSGDAAKDFLISEDEGKKYNIIAFAVANIGISAQGDYEIEIIAKDMEDLITGIGEFDFSSIYSELGYGCYEIDTDAFFDGLSDLMDLSSKFISVLAELSYDDYSDLQAEYNNDVEAAKEQIATAKNELSSYRIMICANYIKTGSNFDAIKKQLQSSIKTKTFNILDERDGSDRFSVFVGFDLLTRSGKVYILAKSEGNIGLVTINVFEK